jgi:hypothetical protein
LIGRGEVFKIILNNECCPHGIHPSAKHGHFRCRYNGANEMCSKNICPLDTDLQAKHDELAELVSEYIEIVDAGLPSDTPMLNARQALRKYLKEAALRKAVEV